MKTTKVKKALAYITRYREGEWQLLVHQHRDHPEAGVQVPGGGVEPNEDEKDAVMREIFEESGLIDLTFIRRVGVYKYFSTYKQEQQLRFVHHFKEKKDEPIQDRWNHVVTSDGEDDGLVFQYFWLPLKEEIDLKGNQGDYIADLLSMEINENIQGEE